MKKIFVPICLLFGIGIIFESCKNGESTAKSSKGFRTPVYKTEAQISSMKNPIDQFNALNQGTFVASRKEKDGTAKEVFVYNVVPVFTENKEDYWLYVEGAMINLLEEPVDQYVIHTVRHNLDTLQESVFRLKDAKRFTLGWYDANKLKSLKKSDLIPAESVCDSWALKNGTLSYKSKSKGMCPSSSDVGSSRAYSEDETIVDYRGICLRTNFYDMNKKQTTAPSSNCNLYPRDVTGRFHKMVYDKAHPTGGK